MTGVSGGTLGQPSPDSQVMRVSCSQRAADLLAEGWVLTASRPVFEMVTSGASDG